MRSRSALKVITFPVRWPMAIVLLMITRLTVPVRMRRIIFNVSLYSNLSELNARTITHDQVVHVGRQLNNLLSLVNSEEAALYFPIYTNRLIWGSPPIIEKEQVVAMGMRRSAQYIIHRTPRWLKYEYEVMQDDVAVLLRKYLGKEALLSCRN